MFILNETKQPVAQVPTFIWKKVEVERMTTVVSVLGKLVAYLPRNKRAYYAWAMTISYRPAQQISIYQLAPPHMRIILFSRWEIGLILGYWGLGLKLGQPIAWFKRLQTA